MNKNLSWVFAGWETFQLRLPGQMAWYQRPAERCSLRGSFIHSVSFTQLRFSVPDCPVFFLALFYSSNPIKTGIQLTSALLCLSPEKKKDWTSKQRYTERRLYTYFLGLHMTELLTVSRLEQTLAFINENLYVSLGNDFAFFFIVFWTAGMWPDMLFTLHIFLQEPVHGARLMPSVDAWLLYVHVYKHVGTCSAGFQSRYGGQRRKKSVK